MSQHHAGDNRTASITLSAFALLAVSITFGLALLQSDVRGDSVSAKNASHTSSQNHVDRSQKPVGVKTGGTGAISGTVTDATTFAPLPGISVWIGTPSRPFLANAITNSSGVYTTPATLEAGTYFARTITSSVYLDELYKDMECEPFCDATMGTPISVTDGATAANINFTLQAGGRISGTLTDAATSAPIANADVAFFNASGDFVTSTVTDISGNYINEEGLPTGTYYVITAAPNHFNELYDNIPCTNCDVTTGTPVSVTATLTTSGINFALVRGGDVSGTVTDEVTGAPIENSSITIFDSSGQIVGFGFTDKAGNYTTAGALATGAYYARVDPPDQIHTSEVYDNIPCFECSETSGTPIPVTIGSTTSGINFSLGVGGAISGRATDANTGDPVNAVIEVYNSSGHLVTSTFRDELGNYTTTSNLPAGVYYVLTSTSVGYIDEVYNDIQCINCNVTSGAPVTVTAGSTTTGIDFALQPGGRITGTVTNAATGEPIEIPIVHIYDSGGAFVASPVLITPEGNYFVEGLPTGIYFARTNVVFDDFAQKLYNDISCAGCSVTMGTPISVIAGSTTTGIDFALEPGGSISGFITDAATSAPLEEFVYEIYNSCGQFVTSGLSNSVGRVTLREGLPTGTYFVVTSNNFGYINEAYNNVACVGCDPTLGTPVTVTAGSITEGINFALSKGSHISGIVAGAGAASPVSSINIFDATGTLVTVATSGDSGIYTTAALRPGTYYVGTKNSAGFVDELYNDIACLNCIPTLGTPISVAIGSDVSGVNFVLNVGGRISGAITDATNSAPIQNVAVQIYNAAGALVATTNTDTFGRYISAGGLPTGTYFVRTANDRGFTDKLYNNITCAGCGVTTGTPVFVTAGSTTSGINLALSPGGRISGTVTNAATSAPLKQVMVEIFNSSGALVTTGATDCSGNYVSQAGMPTGTYFARTTNSRKFIDKLYNNINCALCDPTTGTPISVTSGQTTGGINFLLCPLTISPGSASFAATGGEGVIAVTSSGGCGWTAVSSASWIEITSAPSGTGNGTVSYVVRENLENFTRTGFITIENQTFVVQQRWPGEGGCTFAISPAFANYNAAGGTGSIIVTTGVRCAWQAVSNASWLVVTPGCCGTGDGTILFEVHPNSTGATRTGIISVGSRKFNVKQTAN